MLSKHIIVRGGNRSFQSKSHRTDHCYQQQLTCNNQQIRMYSIQPNAQISYRRCRGLSTIPKSKRLFSIFLHRKSRWIKSINSSRKRTIKSINSSYPNAKSQNTSYRIGTTLVCLNFSCRYILEHYNKKEKNSKSTYIYQQLKQHKIFKTKQYKQTRSVLKLQYQVKNTMYRVLRLCHQIDTSQSSCSYQSKNLTHFSEYKKKRNIKICYLNIPPHLRKKGLLLGQMGFEPITFVLKAHCSAN